MEADVGDAFWNVDLCKECKAFSEADSEWSVRVCRWMKGFSWLQPFAHCADEKRPFQQYVSVAIPGTLVECSTSWVTSTVL